MEDKTIEQIEIPDILLQHVLDTTQATVLVMVSYHAEKGTCVAVRGEGKVEDLINTIQGLEAAKESLQEKVGAGFVDYLKNKKLYDPSIFTASSRAHVTDECAEHAKRARGAPRAGGIRGSNSHRTSAKRDGVRSIHTHPGGCGRE